MIEINAYTVLGMNPWLRNPETGAESWNPPEDDAIRACFLRCLAAAHPELTADPTGDLVQIVHAGDLLLSAGRGAHDNDIRRGLMHTFEPVPLSIGFAEDPVVYLVQQAITHGIGPVVVPLLPHFIDADRLAGLELLGLEEARRDALEVLENAHLSDDDPRADDYGDLVRWLLEEPVQYLFRAKPWTSAGAVVHGKASKIPPAEQARLPGAVDDRPTHRVTLNLGTWLSYGPEQRARLILHEWQHFAPELREVRGRKEWRVKFAAHDIEDFALTLRAFGVAGTAQAEAVVAAAAREDFPAAVKTWEAHFDEQGRGFLFEKLMVPR